MSEPTLESIGDYDTLKGEKKKIVWAVIIAGLLIGVAYEIATSVYGNPKDELHVKDTITIIPGSKSIPVR